MAGGVGPKHAMAHVASLKLRAVRPRPFFDRHTAAISDVAFSPDSLVVASTSADGETRVWDLTGTLLEFFLSGPAQSTAVAFTADSKSLIFGSSDNMYRFSGAHCSASLPVRLTR